MESVILQFKGPFKFLSNFYPADQLVGKIAYPTNEHYYQSCKLLYNEDINTILKIKNPAEVKRLVRTMEQVSLNEWRRYNLTYMWVGLLAKFSNDELAGLLVETGDIDLIEGNYWHDNFWGRCFCSKCQGRSGDNHLGKMLMRIRRLKTNG